MPPVAGVVGAVTVVAEKEVLAVRNPERPELIAQAVLLGQARPVGEDALVAVERVPVVLHPLAVDEEPLVDDLDRVAGQPDAPLDQVHGRLLYRAEDHDVPAPRLPYRQEPPLEGGGRRRVEEAVHEEVIADQEGLFHRAARDEEGLHHEGVREAEEDGGDQERLDVFAQRRPATGSGCVHDRSNLTESARWQGAGGEKRAFVRKF